jgi:hypothetical protein
VVAEPATGGSKRDRAWLVVVVLVPGWLALAASYLLVLPLFGVLSVAIWLLISFVWLWVIVVPAFAAGRLAWRGAVRLMVVCSLLAVVSGAALWTLVLPQRTAEGQFRQHRGDLAPLAADYSRRVANPVKVAGHRTSHPAGGPGVRPASRPAPVPR